MASIRVITRRYTFQLVNEPAPAYPAGASISSPREAVAIAQHVIGSEITECLLAVFLDTRYRVTGYTEIARGTLNATRFTPRDVLVPALFANACGVAVCHNHPSGLSSPSSADRRVTIALREACQLVGITLVDHLIVTATDYFSFREAEGWE